MMERPFLKHYPRPDKRNKPIHLSESERMSIKSKSVVIDKFIESQISLVSRSNIERWINSLTSFHNRHSKSIFINQVANWLKKELEISGYDRKNVIYHKFDEGFFELKNVICNKEGELDRVILVCAHYDTILGENIEDTISRAPGADDNASGVAAILEIARILCKIDLKYDIQFVFFSGEEQGLGGSEHYAQYLKDKQATLELVINLDMIGEPGFLPTKKTVQVDVDNVKSELSCNEVKENDKASEIFAEHMKQMAFDYTDLEGKFGPVYASDYCPFESRGYVVIGAYDGSAEHNNPHYHSSADVPTNLDMEFLTSVTKMVLATILYEAKKVPSE
jgi:hypothetical protein